MQSKKIMMINGSPRAKGNTATILHWVAKGAREAGAEVEIIEAAKLENKVHGCSGCRKCNDSDAFRCAIRDETAALVERMPEQDLLVFATPVFLGNFTAQMKMVLDRMYCLTRYQDGKVSVHPALKNISFALIATAGGGQQSGMNFVTALMRAMVAGIGEDLLEFTVPFCPGPLGVIASDAELQARAVAFGKRLAES